jgi:hypothetical protein
LKLIAAINRSPPGGSVLPAAQHRNATPLRALGCLSATVHHSNFASRCVGYALLTASNHGRRMTMAAEELLDRLDEQAILLEALLERHPGRHLLAEYEATLLEPCCFVPKLHRDPEMLDHAANLLARMEHVISSLTTSSSEPCSATIPGRAVARL